MALAPLAFLRGKQPSRKTTKSSNPCHYTDSQGRTFMIEYLTPTKKQPFSHRQIFPAAKPGHRFEPSNFGPPPHYHILQDEHFKVESGKGIWYLAGGVKLHLQKGDELSVKRQQWHWFEPDPQTAEPFSILCYYDKEYIDMEFRFFRNTLSYLADCHEAGLQMSVFQLQVFSMHNWMPISVVNHGPEPFKFVVNTLLTVVMGCIGEFLLGYRKSYPEYYKPGREKQA